MADTSVRDDRSADLDSCFNACTERKEFPVQLDAKFASAAHDARYKQDAKHGL